jgi:hypothetical protein
MFDSAVIDIAIGMIFIFLIASFGVTAGNELLSSLFKWRARILARGIRGMFGGQTDETAIALARKIYRHPLIRGLHRDHGEEDDRRKPSSIPSSLFATALFDIALRPAGSTKPLAPKTLEEARKAVDDNRPVLGDQVTGVLLAFLDQAEREGKAEAFQIEALQSDIEGWFNYAMERLGGWYKRRTQFIGFIVGIGIVTFTNIDSIRCARALANNQVLRATLIAEATKASAAGLPAGMAAAAPAPPLSSGVPSAAPLAQAPGSAPPTSVAPQTAAGDGDTLQDKVKAFKKLEADINEISDLGIPMGWSSEVYVPFPTTGKGIFWWLYKIGGLLLTATAASFGAPFWFGLLQRVIPLRKGKEQEAPPK